MIEAWGLSDLSPAAAAGVAEANADIIQVSGHDGGTGASPVSSIKHAGGPIEMGLVETHRTLLQRINTSTSGTTSVAYAAGDGNASQPPAASIASAAPAKKRDKIKKQRGRGIKKRRKPTEL